MTPQPLIWTGYLKMGIIRVSIKIVYLKGRNFRGKKILRISRILAKFAKINSFFDPEKCPFAKINSREIFQTWWFAKIISRQILQE